MPPAPDLFQLIKGLNKAERRYFTLQATSGKGATPTATMELYQLLSNAPTYDESMIKAALGFAENDRRLAVLKFRLMRQILTSLRWQYEDKDPSAMLKAIEGEVSLLFERKLWRTCGKRLKKARALARKWERWNMLLTFLEWEQRLFLADPRIDQEEFFAKIESTESEVLQNLQLQTRLHRLNIRVRKLVRTHPRARTDKEKERIESLLKLPEIARRPSENLFICNVYYHNINGLLRFALGEYNGALRHYESQLKQWMDRPEWTQMDPGTHLSSLNNYLNICLIHPRRTELFPPAVKSLQAFVDLLPKTDWKLERILYTQRVTYAINFEPYDLAKVILEEAEQWLQTVPPMAVSMHSRLSLQYNFCAFHFVYGDFSASNRSLSRIIHFPSGPDRPDIRDFARIMQLVLQYELGNLDLQEYLLRSAHRYFNKTQKLDVLEKGIIRMMRYASKHGTIAPEEFQVFHDLLVQLKADDDGRLPVGTNEFLIWVESKLKGEDIRSHFEELFREQDS